MVIAVVCDVLGEENNGTSVAAMNLIRFLKSRGHEVRVLCADKDKEGQEGFYIVPQMSFGKFLDGYIKKVGVTLAKPNDDIIRKVFEGCQAVHILVPLLLGMRAVKIAREMNIPMTASFHMQAENFTCYFKINGIKIANTMVYDYIWDHVYRYVDAIHYPTEFIKNIFESSIKKLTPSYVISNGVHDYIQKRSVEKPAEYKDKIVLLTTGRYSKEKSQDTLIKAIKYSKYKDKIQLIVGGQGLKEKKYRRLAKKLPVQPIFKFFSRTDIIDVLNYCDMYVHPAIIELEGISCIEAIICGKLTIVSDSKLSATKGFAVDERCVFKHKKPKDLARVIDYWIENAAEREKVAQKYYESGAGFNQEKCMMLMESMIFDAIKKHSLKKEENRI